MKFFILLLSLVLISLSSLADVPYFSCTSADGDMHFDFSFNRSLEILTYKDPEQRLTIPYDELEINSTTVSTMPTERKGNSSRTVELRFMTMKKKDGSAMPNSYDRTVGEDGSLSDYFICVSEH